MLKSPVLELALLVFTGERAGYDKLHPEGDIRSY